MKQATFIDVIILPPRSLKGQESFVTIILAAPVWMYKPLMVNMYEPMTLLYNYSQYMSLT